MYNTFKVIVQLGLELCGSLPPSEQVLNSHWSPDCIGVAFVELEPQRVGDRSHTLLATPTALSTFTHTHTHTECSNIITKPPHDISCAVPRVLLLVTALLPKKSRGVLSLIRGEASSLTVLLTGFPPLPLLGVCCCLLLTGLPPSTLLYSQTNTLYIYT